MRGCVFPGADSDRLRGVIKFRDEERRRRTETRKLDGLWNDLYMSADRGWSRSSAGYLWLYTAIAAMLFHSSFCLFLVPPLCRRFHLSLFFLRAASYRPTLSWISTTNSATDNAASPSVREIFFKEVPPERAANYHLEVGFHAGVMLPKKERASFVSLELSIPNNWRVSLHLNYARAAARRIMETYTGREII